MKKIGMILILILIVLTGFWVWAVVDQNQTSSAQVQQKLFAKQSSDQGEVIVEVTPISLEAGKEARFKVVFETHSVELNYDLWKISSLTDNQGNSLKLISWSGGSGGHHLSGKLTFPAIAQNIKSLELTIFNIEGVDRKFKWDL